MIDHTGTTILVTGGAGYIGSVTAQYLLERGYAVRVVDDLSTGWRDAVPTACEFLEGSILDLDIAAAACNGVRAVIHLAAKSIVADSVRDPGPYWETNLIGTRNLLEGMRRCGVDRLVFSSTAAVYGDPCVDRIVESTATRPVNPYGATKLAAESMISAYCSAYGIGAVVLRYFNVGGAYRHLGERHDPETHLIPLVLGGSPLTVFGTDWPTPDGTCVRDYLHVADLADAHHRALTAAVTGTVATVNLGTGTGYSVFDVIAAATEITERAVDVRFGPRRDGDPARLVTGNDAARALLGWAPQRDLRRIVSDAHTHHVGGFAHP